MSEHTSSDPAAEERARAVAHVDGSFRAEGLEPSYAAQIDGVLYAAGSITLEELKERAFQRARELAEQYAPDSDS